MQIMCQIGRGSGLVVVGAMVFEWYSRRGRRSHRAPLGLPQRWGAVWGGCGCAGVGAG